MGKNNVMPGLLIILLLVNCSSGNRFASDTEIQNEITAAVNDYNSDNWETRLKAIKNVSRYTDSVYAKNSLLLVFKALDDSHSEIRIESLKTLKKMKAPAAEERIRNIALNDNNPNARYYAFSALEEYQSIKNEDVFVKGLGDRDWLVKEASLKGLLKINYPGIQKKYLGIILDAINDKNISIRLTCLSNINIKDPLIYAELAEIINDRESGVFLLKAALKAVKGYKLDDNTRQRIIGLLTHRDKEVRILSLQALKQDGVTVP